VITAFDLSYVRKINERNRTEKKEARRKTSCHDHDPLDKLTFFVNMHKRTKIRLLELLREGCALFRKVSPDFFRNRWTIFSSDSLSRNDSLCIVYVWNNMEDLC
jgi:hypothetical protein